MSRFRIVPERSTIHAGARSSIHPILVDTSGLEGWIDAEVDRGRLQLDVPVAAHVELAAARLQTGNVLYDRELERRLEARRYPRIMGDVQEVRAVRGGGRYRVRGTLTFHGVTKPVEGEVTIKITADSTLVIDGRHELDMRDFGLEPPRLLMLRVYPEIDLRGHVVAEREG